MRVLVTGGAGYIGSHTAKELARQGHCPVVLDNMTYGHEWAVRWGPLYQGDILDISNSIEVIKKEKIEAVLHFAAFAYVGESVKEPLKYYKNNVIGSLHLFEAMRLSGVKKIIFSSTCASYGLPHEVPIKETFPQVPINPYGQSKLMVETILRDYVRAYQFSVTSLRYFNAAGADLEMEIGEAHDPETHLIPLALQAAHHSDKRLTVFGNDYNTKDGTCIRDYIHVSDLACAHVLALDKIQKGNFVAFNLGTGSGASVQEVLEQVAATTGKKVHFSTGPRREGDPPCLVASGEKALRELGWNPKSSSLKEIVETANIWYLKHLGEKSGK